MAEQVLQSGLTASKKLFAGFHKDEIAAILAAAIIRKFEPHHIVTRTGELAKHLYLLKKGSVNICRSTPGGKDVLLLRLSSEGIFGLGTVLSGPIGYIATAETLTECELYVWEQAWAHRYASTHPEFALNALRIALEYIGLYAERHIALVSDDAHHRLAHTLTRLGSKVGRPHHSGIEVDIKNEDLASLADTSMFTASRHLKAWDRKGAVKKTRGKVIIRCPEKLLAK